MICGNCGLETPSEGRYCIHCGSSLTDDSAQEVDSGFLQREIRRLRLLINDLNDRISSIEREHGILPVDFESAEPDIPAAEEVYEETVEEPAVSEVVAEEEEKITPAVETWKSPIDVTKPVSPPAVKKEPSAIQREWEQILGGNWLARIGVFSLVIGTGFFLKFAFDRNWLGPLGRVILGVAAGFIMLAGGHYWRKKYPTFAQAISGGGIAVLYLSVFAAYVMFGLTGFYTAIILLFAVSALAAFIAVKYDSMALAILGITGAFIAPFILAVSSSTAAGLSDPAASIWLLVYVFIIDIGVLCLSTFRNWRWFNSLAFAGSLAVFGIWYSRFGDDVGLFTVQGSLTVIFLVFVGVTTLYHVLWRRIPDSIDYMLMVLNATAYFGISYALLKDDIRPWMGTFTFSLALLYGGLAYLLYSKGRINARLALFALGIALIFFTIAIPVQLGDKAWATIGWAAEASVLIWISLKTDFPRMRISGYLVYLAAVVRLLFFDTVLENGEYSPVLNERFLAFIFGIAITYLTSFILWRRDSELTEYEHSTIFNYRFFVVAANLLSLWIIAAEVISYLDRTVPTGSEWQLSLLLVLAVFTVLIHGLWRYAREMLSFSLLVIDAFVFYVISGILGVNMNDWAGLLFLFISVVFGILAYLFRRAREENPELFMLVLGISLLSINVAVPAQLGDVVWTPLIWAVESAVLVWLSFTFKLPLYRLFAYALSLVLVGRLLIFDSHVTTSTFVPFINERFPAFAVSIAALFISAFIIRRNYASLYKSETEIFRVYPVFLVGANVLTILILSMEIWGYFSREIYDSSILQESMASISGLRSARNLSLTAIWAVYAIILLVLGITRQSRYMRLAGLGLITIPILKVYIYDVFALEQIYRIFAFIGLGILLVVSGYLYNRYRAAIRDFITEK